MFIFHISDLHYDIKDQKGIRNIQKVIDNITHQDITPDVVLISGDIINRNYNNYQSIFEMLKQLQAPFYCIPGNHDISTDLQKALIQFVPKHPTSQFEGKLQYVVDDYPVRIIALDSYKDEASGGELCVEQLKWLEEKLSDNSSKKPVLVMVHQFTLNAGSVFFDKKTPGKWYEGFNQIIAQHKDTVKLVACGHMHNSLISNINGIPIISCFSANWQAHFDFEATDNMVDPSRPVGYYIHNFKEGKFISYAMAV